MKFIKKHITLVVAIVVILLIVAGLLILNDIFNPSESKAIYGNRLEEVDKHKISNDTQTKVKEALSEGATSVEMRISGRIIYIDVKVNGDTSVESAKNLGNKALEVFTDDEKGYYDIQVMIDNDVNTNQFPIIGYKHHSKTAMTWTKDR